MSKTSLPFDVFLNRKKIDTVWQACPGIKTKGEAEKEVKEKLTDHDGYNPDIIVRLAVPVYSYDWDILGDYGQGFEILCNEPTKAKALAILKDYQTNAPGVAYKIKRVRNNIFKG